MGVDYHQSFLKCKDELAGELLDHSQEHTMDWIGLTAMVTALATAYAMHLKNRLQDTVSQGVKNELATLTQKVAECEKERDHLRKRRRRRPTKKTA